MSLVAVGSLGLRWGEGEAMVTMNNRRTLLEQYHLEEHSDICLISSRDTSSHQFSTVQLLSHVWFTVTPWTASRQASLSIMEDMMELAQIHIHWVGDAIQPSHPLSSPSPPAFNLSQHQGLFKWVSSSHQVAKVLEFQLQSQSFQWIFRTDFL